MMLDKKLLSVREVSNILGCNYGMVYDLLRKGMLAGFKYEGRSQWYIPEESVKNFIDQHISRMNQIIQKNNTQTSR